MTVVYKPEVWRRQKESIMTAIKQDAAANGKPLDEFSLQMIEMVLDMENKAYEAGYSKGYQDGKAVSK